jgi:hypothetical protein
MIVRLILGLLAIGVVWSLITGGSGDGLDFGDCRQVPNTQSQECTYDDGHSETLDLSDMTGR